MPSEIITAVAALGGVLVGGFINYVASRSVKHREWTLAIARDQIAARQKLYAEFLVEAQRLVVQAIEGNRASASGLDALNGKFAEISLVAPDSVVAAARAVCDYALSVQSIDKEARPKGDFFKLRQAFIEHARKDVLSIQRDA